MFGVVVFKFWSLLLSAAIFCCSIDANIIKLILFGIRDVELLKYYSYVIVINLINYCPKIVNYI